MKKIITYFFTMILLSCGSLVAQTLEGTVLGRETNEPVHNALVYLDGTSFVTVTNTEGKFKLSVKNTLYTYLIISHISYERAIVGNPFDKLPKIIYLDEKINLLDEVTVSAKSIFTREQMLEAFRKQFLGNSEAGKSCKILNEDDIVLRYNTADNILSALSNVPLKIENKYLGYKIRWEIVEFKIQYNEPRLEDGAIRTALMTGTAAFEDMEPDKKRTAKHRKDVYEISSRNFFNLIANEKLSESNFSLYYKNTEYSANELFKVLTDINNRTIKHIIVNFDKKEDAVLTVKQNVSERLKRYFQRFGGGFSDILFLIDTFYVDSYGNTNSVRNILLGGEMGRQRIGDMLPLEYTPPSTKKVETQEPQEVGSEDKMYAQLEAFPQEKIHIQTDKNVYLSGEKIWYRAFLVNALLHVPMYASRYVYMELIAPSGELISRDKIRPDSVEAFHNNIALDENLPEGTYLIRAYTNFMRNRPDYFFEKKVFVATDLQSSEIKIIPSFSIKEKKGTVKVNFQNGEDEPITVKYLNMRADTGTWEFVDVGEKFSFGITPEKQQFIYMEFESGGRMYKKYITVPPAANDFDVSFFPEGGYLIAGELCKTGFKALQTNGFSEDIKGEIISDGGDTVAVIESEHAGMGSFSFLSEKGKTYYAVCRNKEGHEKRFQLPDSNAEACVLKVSAEEDEMYITALKGAEFKDRLLNIVVHVRGALVYAGELPERNAIAINKRSIPSGVVQILLLDNNMNLLSERLLFNLGKEELTKVNLSTDKPGYKTREKVSAQVRITDEADNPLNGSFSVSVTDDGDVLPDSLFSIISNLLLCSDIRGYVESPEYYLQNPNNADILMLTQAWKRYDIPVVLKGDIEKPVHFPEARQKISGKVKRVLSNKANVNNTVSFLSSDGYANTTKTDENGRFVFTGFESPDSTLFVVQAKAKSKLGKNYVELVLDEETFPETTTFPAPEEYKLDGLLEKYVIKSDQRYIDEYGMRAILLDTVTITVPRTKPKSIYSSALSKVIYPDDYKHIKGLNFTRLIQIFGIRTFAKRLYGGKGSPIFVVDDMLIYGDESDRVYNIPITDIKCIEFVEPVLTLTMSSDPYLPPGGILIITTKSETFWHGRTIRFNIKAWFPTGYRKAAEFYSPKYETEEDFKKGTDRRTTIFWKPNVIFINGSAQFDFYTADYKTTYSAVIEGVANNGQIVRKTEKISVKGKNK